MGILDGKVAVVTGASRGIGRGAAIGLAREGAAVVIAARTLSPAQEVKIDGDGASVSGSLEEVAKQIEAEGGTAVPVACDLSDARSVENLVQVALDRFGRIDVLVNNGQPQSTLAGRFWEMPASAFDTHIAVGARSYYLAAHAAVPAMIKQGSGCIVNISSPGACFDFFCAPYSIARAAADRMTQSFASELNGTGVRAYSLWPSFIRTERVVMAASGEDAGFQMPPGFDPETQASSPEMVGLAIAHLAADTKEAERNGTALTLYEVSETYGFTDYDGRPAMRHASVENAIGKFGRVIPHVFTKMAK